MGARRKILCFLIMALSIGCIIAYAGCGGGGGSSSGGGTNPTATSTTATPTVASVTSPLISGSSCTVTGSGFGSSRNSKDSGNSFVSFISTSDGGTTLNASAYSSWSDTTIVCTAPTLQQGQSYTVVVNLVTSTGTTASSTAQSSANTVPVIDSTKAPVISAISPANQIAGQAIVLTGTNFGSSQGSGSSAGYVVIGSTIIASGLVWSDTSVAATIPTTITTGTQLVYVHTGIGGNSNTVSLLVTNKKPTITKLSANTVLHGSNITITGTNFGTTQEPNYVQIGTTQITSGLVWTDKSIICTIPTSIAYGTYYILVHTATGGDSNSLLLYVTANTPTISSISPSSPVQGEAMTITGTYFGTSQGTGYVMIGTEKVSTVTSWSNTVIKLITPTTVVGALKAYVHTANDGDTPEASVTIATNKPSVTSISPTNAPLGGTVTLTGTKFGTPQATGDYVQFGTVQQTTSSTWSDTSIICTVPTAVPTSTAVPVLVHNSKGSSDTVNMSIYDPSI